VERIASRKTPRLVLLLSAIILCTQALPLWSADSRRFATVPALGVLADGQTGIVHYVVLQIDKGPRHEGPTVQFNEINLGGGSIVSEDWKEGVKQAVAAATRAVGEDGQEWVITIKNRSYNALTEGMSASSAIAVGTMAAWRGDDVKATVALTGTIMPDGQIKSVGAIFIKVEAAARAQFTTILVPRGQRDTVDWNLPSWQPDGTSTSLKWQRWRRRISS
jgi:predicted S18 family serine protease